MNLADALLPRTYADGERIIEQGDTADGMYFVEEGTVRITIQNENNTQVEVTLTTFLNLTRIASPSVFLESQLILSCCCNFTFTPKKVSNSLFDYPNVR